MMHLENIFGNDIDGNAMIPMLVAILRVIVNKE